MTRLPIILSAAYWIIAVFLLWEGYRGDAEMDRLSASPVTHSPVFDVAVSFGLVAIVYLVAAAIWWGVVKIARSAAGPANTKA